MDTEFVYVALFVGPFTSAQEGMCHSLTQSAQHESTPRPEDARDRRTIEKPYGPYLSLADVLVRKAFFHRTTDGFKHPQPRN